MEPRPQIVFTNKARCRDCYRCVRVCPVKAIRMQDGQASVDETRCIACGTCIRECPQKAKSFRNDVERAAQLLTKGRPVAVSLAPSYAAVYSDWERRRLPSALRKLGFTFIAETAVGAYHVARRTAELLAAQPNRPLICTACPAVVSFIEAYRPQWIDRLAPVASPMIVHARHLRERLGPEARVVFIGPCVAKKAEAERPEHAGLVDAALTFTELHEWLEREGIALAALEESGFDEEPAGEARHFPLVGGLARTAALGTDLMDARLLAVSGCEEMLHALESLDEPDGPVLVEALFCPQGCVNGPAMPDRRNPFARRRETLQYAGEHAGAAEPAGPAPVMEAHFAGRDVRDAHDVPEERIQAILEQSGKSAPSDQLNCGSCGYASCRDKAVAVALGLAELEMCVPHMRRLAEQRTDRIIETSPNGIAILDERLHIIHMNPAFRRSFMCSDQVEGRHISYLMDPDPFEQVAAGAKDRVELTVAHDKYGLVCHQIVYALREERQYVGIFVNVTHSQSSQRMLTELRRQTARQAQELLEHQVQMAQKMAQFLGESTARGETLVENLLRLTREGETGNGR